MSVHYSTDGTILLVGDCLSDDVEELLQALSANPEAVVDWRECEAAHSAVIQLLLVSGCKLRGPAKGHFLSAYIGPNFVRIGTAV
jgi:hypothetical protein